ncbi:MAG: bifunctional (p)ppGpp synthetase/guanosine-3',5'-bis(diphosphate) 3'-pyrophosphohydrolase [Ardenticatenaceae bacterium]|nr:bifunctional (p)ppGpp synthetase/guanosine-3',5'-bis(diphosphate) 3'-pyrophosphohydrolase [Ardenticatenaceae bacterium]
MPLNWSQESYTKTYRFAAKAHDEQLFPGTELPYIMHLSFVSMEVLAALAHEPERDGDLAVQCALLHDVIEDTAVGYEDVKAGFGTAVADGVLALTKNPDLPKDQQMADSLHRIRQQPSEIWLVKLADRITNLAEPPHYWDREKKVRYQAEARQIHAALHEASPYLSQRLLAKIEAYAAYF